MNKKTIEYFDEQLKKKMIESNNVCDYCVNHAEDKNQDPCVECVEELNRFINFKGRRLKNG